MLKKLMTLLKTKKTVSIKHSKPFWLDLYQQHDAIKTLREKLKLIPIKETIPERLHTKTERLERGDYLYVLAVYLFKTDKRKHTLTWAIKSNKPLSQSKILTYGLENEDNLKFWEAYNRFHDNPSWWKDDPRYKDGDYEDTLPWGIIAIFKGG